MTEKLYQDDPRLRATTATVVSAAPEGIELDRTIFYARGGGQPGDTGVLRWDGGETPIADTVKGEGETVLHLPAPGAGRCSTVSPAPLMVSAIGVSPPSQRSTPISPGWPPPRA